MIILPSLECQLQSLSFILLLLSAAIKGEWSCFTHRDTNKRRLAWLTWITAATWWTLYGTNKSIAAASSCLDDMTCQTANNRLRCMSTTAATVTHSLIHVHITACSTIHAVNWYHSVTCCACSNSVLMTQSLTHSLTRITHKHWTTATQQLSAPARYTQQVMAQQNY